MPQDVFLWRNVCTSSTIYRNLSRTQKKSPDAEHRSGITRASTRPLFRLTEFVTDTHAPPIADGGVPHLGHASPDQAETLPRSAKLGRVGD